MANYSIIGSDGKEYGPVGTDELRKWLADGRIGPETRVRAEGTTEWRLLSEVPELGSAPKTTLPPPPITALPATGKISALAITSLVLGTLGLFTCGTTALVGLILGIIAMVKVANSRGALRGKGIALAGTIVSAVFLLMIPFFAAMLLPALASAKSKAMEINCVNNEKQLALAVMIYSGDHANHLPPAATWCDAIQTNAGPGNVFRCPASGNAASRCDYAFNAKLDGLDTSKINPQTVLIFESDGGWNAHGGAELLASPRHPRHNSVVAFADGHAEIESEAKLKTLRWDP
jgi:prepilin-type processing-associated H-X9-DG protein